ncbi:HEAT repeat domain-containing protein [Kitasatospora sp. NPDC053057]|uniref:HEAT repeat domain-containing protein n=1 Tax=Kitasatospora sp. NPDC053057 TaxID=3364062 RepID=UPI0037C816FD
MATPLPAGHPIDSREGALRSYDAVRAELPRLRALLDDPHGEVRTRTAYLLGWFPEESAQSTPPLLRRLETEQDPRTAATVLLAIGFLGERATADRLRPHLDAEHPLLRWAAATALARLFLLPADPLSDPQLLERVVAELVNASIAPAPEPRTDHNDDGPHHYTARTLLALGDLTADDAQILIAIAHCLGFMEARTIHGFAPHLLRTAFEPVGDAAFADLTPAQQAILRVVADRLPADLYDHWVTGSGVRDALSALDLPDSRPALRAYTGLPPVDGSEPRDDSGCTCPQED